jgi:hypothetical protein
MGYAVFILITGRLPGKCGPHVEIGSSLASKQAKSSAILFPS